jgi:CRISPR-associated protein Cst2
MLKFVTFAVKTQLNVHDLNNEAVAGNVMDIRIMEFLGEDGGKKEAPAVSGRMLKHWHYEAMRQLINSGLYSTVHLCAGCKAGEPIRPGQLSDGNLIQVAKAENTAIQECAVCDIHGYLIAQGAQQEGEGGVSARRASRSMFSWLMPAIGPDTASKQVIHTRVSQQVEMAAGEGAAQMIFNKSYASGIYAFVSALDIERIGLMELKLDTTDKYAIDNTERTSRVKAAIEAYRYLISGQMGASLSHAVPHGNPMEILVAYSESGPLPFPVSPMYSDYIAKTKGLMPQGTTLLYWGVDTKQGITKKNNIDDLFTELLSKTG